MKTMPRDYVKGSDGLFRKVEQFPGESHTEILCDTRHAGSSESSGSRLAAATRSAS